MNSHSQSYTPEIQLSDSDPQPTDTISKISWGPSSSRTPIFATSNWDSHIRIYQVNVSDKTLTQKTSFTAGGPSLCVNWHPEMTRVFTGCAPNSVKEFDVETGKGMEIGKHRAQVKDVHWLPTTQTLCSISADKTIKFWDTRQSQQVGEIKLKYQPYCSDLFENRLLLGLSESKILLFDTVEAQKTRDSEFELNYMNSALISSEPYCGIKFMGDGTAFGLGCLDGYGNYSGFGNLENLEQNTVINRIKWKAGRTSAGEQVPVKSIFVSKRNENFIGTCGNNGKFTFWDCQAKSRVVEFDIGAPLACSVTSPDGNLLALATGENWHRGEVDAEIKKSKIFVHIMKDEQLTAPNKITNAPQVAAIQQLPKKIPKFKSPA